MTKNRVIVFDTIGKARVFITDDPDSVIFKSGETKLVNPDLSYVQDIPPELWNLENNKVMPLFDPDAIRARLADIGVKSFTNMADAEIKKNVSKLVDIPKGLQDLDDSLNIKLSGVYEILYKKIQEHDTLSTERIDNARFDVINKVISNINHSHQLLVLELERIEKRMIKDHIEHNLILSIVIICCLILGYLINHR